MDLNESTDTLATKNCEFKKKLVIKKKKFVNGNRKKGNIEEKLTDTDLEFIKYCLD